VEGTVITNPNFAIAFSLRMCCRYERFKYITISTVESKVVEADALAAALTAEHDAGKSLSFRHPPGDGPDAHAPVTGVLPRKEI
jgi:hypothetical protein